MNPWRIETTVLTDLSASMFSACFVVLLIFLQLAQQPGPPPSPVPIEATRDLAIVRQTVLSPEAMVELLRGHGGGDGPGIDLFEDRVELRAGGGAPPTVLAGAAIGREIAAAVAQLAPGPARLYVFSNAHYAAVSASLARAGLARQEISVPQALRDPARPMAGWSADFLALDGERLEAGAFRQRLAALLAGGAENGAASEGGAAEPPAGPAASDLLTRLRAWLALLAAVLVPLAGLAVTGWIERSRWRPDTGHMDRAAAPH